MQIVYVGWQSLRTIQSGNQKRAPSTPDELTAGMVSAIRGWSDTARTVGDYEACMTGCGTGEVED